MDGRKETCTVNLNGNIILTLKTMALMKYPLRKAGYHIDTGTILVLGTERMARQFVEVIAETGDVEIIDNLFAVNVDNYKMAIHLYSKRDNPKLIESFLSRKDIFPVVIVAGVVPKEFQNQFYIFKAEIPIAYKNRLAYEEFKEFVLSDVKVIFKALQLLETADVLQYEVISEDFEMLHRCMIAVGWLWKVFLRDNGINRLKTDTLFRKYLVDVRKWVNNIERFEGEYGISEAIKSVLISYSVEKNLKFYEGIVLDSESTENLSEFVFYDADYYYFSETLLKKICAPLLDTISFLQLKQEMYAEEMLICNDNSKRNYTVKKELFFAETSTKIRLRFLKISRESLISDEGFEPLDYVLMNQENFVNEFSLLEREGVES